MNHSEIIRTRWYEAVAKPTYAKWHSLASMLAAQADLAETHAPESPMAKELRRMYEDAYDEVIRLQNQKETA